MTLPKPMSKSAPADDRGFLFQMFLRAPREIGAVAASGPALARAVASQLDPAAPGHIVELGGGTGALTQGIIARGIPAERLVIFELHPPLCRVLRQRFPGAKVIEGDAMQLGRLLTAAGVSRVAAVVSALPLLNMPESTRAALLDQSFTTMGEGGRFVQITYGPRCPVPRDTLDDLKLDRRLVRTVWLNLPPTHIWLLTRRRVAGNGGGQRRHP
jgi:phosphatidylethanolamine/phosphatidyl-N-methylethanolamine N-methyltransferase